MSDMDDIIECSDYDEDDDVSDCSIDISDSEEPRKKDQALWDYKVHSLEQVLDMMKQIAVSVSEVIQLPIPAIHILMRSFKWDKEKICEKFYDYSEVEGFLESHAALDLSSSINDVHEGICSICCDVGPVRSLKCRHEACNTCWNAYIEEKVKFVGTVDIKCINCDIFLHDEQVASLVVDESLLNLYYTLMTNAFVDSNPLFKWCPGANCQRIFELSTRAPTSVFCKCGEDICSGCNQGAHLPLSCARAVDWRDGKRRGIESTMEWIDKYTRPCPKCQARIQKLGGCNFMQCTNSTCKVYFCWVCMKEMATSHQSHECGLHYEDEPLDSEEIDYSESKATFSRYRKKEAAERKELHDHLDFHIDEMRKKGCTEKHTKLVLEAAQTLLEGRRALSYFEACLYYLRKLGDTNIFTVVEMAGKSLENAIKSLSGILNGSRLEKYDFSSFEKDVGQLNHYEGLARNRHKALLDSCTEAVEKGLF